MNFESKFKVYYIRRNVPYEKTITKRLKRKRVFIVFLLSVDIELTQCLTSIRCTWCCDVGADVPCGGVIRCVEVIKLCVDVLVGILGVLGVNVLSDVLGDVPSKNQRLKSRFRRSLVQSQVILIKSELWRSLAQSEIALKSSF